MMDNVAFKLLTMFDLRMFLLSNLRALPLMKI